MLKFWGDILMINTNMHATVAPKKKRKIEGFDVSAIWGKMP